MADTFLFGTGLLLSDAPWYFLACVPFCGGERLKRRYLLIIFSAVLLLRIIVGCVLFKSTPGWMVLDAHYYTLHTVIMLALYFVCFKVNFAKLLYTLLLLQTMATTVNYLESMLVVWLYKGANYVISATPGYVIATLVFSTAVFPFAYRFFNGVLRQSFSELPAKSIFKLCVAPIMFFALGYAYSLITADILGISTVAAQFTHILISITGIVTYYITIRMVVDAAKYAQTEKEAAALERLNILKTDLMRTISHETLTPLAVMMGYSEITARDARKSGQSLEFVENLDNIAAEAKRIAEMIEEMRQIAIAREYSKDTHPVDIKKVIMKIAGLYSKVLGRKGTKLKLDVADGLPLVIGNESEFTQVIFNLLRNSDMHTENGKVTIRAERQSGNIKVTVSDTGGGIPQELLPRVFERGVHGDKGGSGFGLAICRDIVTAYGGEISIDSQIGTGTTVVFTLPIYKEGDSTND